jgi:multicomponent Na+:H+ antiporter subunit A
MTIGVVFFGIILFKTWANWQKIYHLFPEKLTLNKFYDTILDASGRLALRFTEWYMNGSIRNYLVYIFLFFIGILGFTLFYKEAFHMESSNVAPVGIYELILSLILIIGSITILFAKSRLTSIILLGAVGYTVALLFVVFRAPDLALTQLVIETVSVALFLLCFYHLPNFRRNEEPIGFKAVNLLISIGVGLIVTLIALSSHSTKLFPSISNYYIENTYKKAGGENMVNVILVDFRGFDTMFEICVLAIAALGIFSMIKLRLTRRKNG